jgi:CheY-like chemotaxis protein
LEEERAVTILVVDDEPEYRLMLKSVLNIEGHEVITAENGAEGLKTLRMSDIDLVISDVYMPVMDGPRFHRAVRAEPQWITLPFLFVSAYDDDHTLESVKDPRYDGFFRKAGPLEMLFEWITFLTTPVERRTMPRPRMGL